MYRVTRKSDASVVESESLLGAVFHALSCSVRDASELVISDGTTTLCLVRRGKLYVAGEELDVEAFVARAAARTAARVESTVTSRAARAEDRPFARTTRGRTA